MKRWILACLVMPVIFVACADKKNDSTQVAVVPPPTNCIDGSTYCNSNQYGTNNGYAAYPQNPYYYNTPNVWNGSYGGGAYVGNFCNCPIGQRPVYNGQFGLGCVSTAQFQPVAYGAVYWGWGANNNQWVSTPQVSNRQVNQPSNGCFQNVAQSCFVDQLNSCGSGAICQATGGGSRLGICTKTVNGVIPASGGGGIR